MNKIIISFICLIFAVISAFTPIQIFEISLIETIKNILFLILFLGGFIAVWLPNRIVNTKSCRRNLYVVLVILGSACLIIGNYRIGMTIFTVLLIALGAYYAMSWLKDQAKEEQDSGCGHAKNT